MSKRPAGRNAKPVQTRAPLKRSVGPIRRVWFTSDTHFGHDAIRHLVDRPFKSVQAMDEALIKRWNGVVGHDDDVWHLGDFAFLTAGPVEGLRSRLNGRIHLVLGNHDHGLARKEPNLFESIHHVAELHLGGRVLIMCHYPMREWPKAWRGAWHLYGHVHGHLDDAPYGHSLDVGVDSHDLAPIGIDRIAALLEGRETPFPGGEDRSEMHRRARQTRKGQR